MALQAKNTFKHRLLSSMGKAARKKALASVDLQKQQARTPDRGDVVGKQKAAVPAAHQQTTAALSSFPSMNDAGNDKASTPTLSQKHENKSRERSQSATMDLGMEQATSEAGISTSVIVGKKKRGRPSKLAAAVRLAVNSVEESATITNGRKELVPTTIASVYKRKVMEKEPSAVKRTRGQERDGMDVQLLAIEREALLKRVKDEQKQRHEVYELERAKLECELKSKQVQLLYEKASARKKLDQLGVSQEEVDRILPL
uniref:Uncharacterized protein n=1 Tax=Peronospora matthiolae TaxID=2874970 RepID=A0AAV1TAG8_9STRA